MCKILKKLVQSCANVDFKVCIKGIENIDNFIPFKRTFASSLSYKSSLFQIARNCLMKVKNFSKSTRFWGNAYFFGSVFSDLEKIRVLYDLSNYLSVIRCTSLLKKEQILRGYRLWAETSKLSKSIAQLKKLMHPWLYIYKVIKTRFFLDFCDTFTHFSLMHLLHWETISRFYRLWSGFSDFLSKMAQLKNKFVFNNTFTLGLGTNWIIFRRFVTPSIFCIVKTFKVASNSRVKAGSSLKKIAQLINVVQFWLSVNRAGNNQKFARFVSYFHDF